jgi:hypothetical protein
VSDAITVTGTTTAVTIYGTFAAAKDYIASTYGPQYTTWTALSDDDKKRTLIAALRYLEAFAWDPTTAADFATRDAIAAFPQAEYELAVIVAGDPDVPGNIDQGSNIRGVGAGSARVDFFAPQSALFGTAPVMPQIVQRLVGQYLATSTASSGGAPDGQEASCESPFSPCEEYRRNWPY